MKKTLIRTVLVTVLLVAGGSTPVVADVPGPRPPYCYPGIICN